MKKFLISTALCSVFVVSSVSFPYANEIETVKNRISSTLVQIAQSPDPAAVMEDLAKDYVLGEVNNQINLLEEQALQNSNWKYLGVTLGFENDEPSLEVMSVYGLHETSNWFFFNQSSLNTYDQRTTLNVGFGARHINDAESLILGANAFYDYEFGSEHRRVGVGVEAFTEDLEFRANGYRALTGEILYDSVYETALDGYDVKLTYNMPEYLNSSLYFLTEYWENDSGYSTDKNSLGLTAELAPNLTANLAVAKTGDENAQGEVSIAYSIPFGGGHQITNTRSTSSSPRSLRNMLYIPVERENRIHKSSVRLGVTMSGV